MDRKKLSLKLKFDDRIVELVLYAVPDFEAFAYRERQTVAFRLKPYVEFVWTAVDDRNAIVAHLAPHSASAMACMS
jgi:hypothetical protein